MIPPGVRARLEKSFPQGLPEPTWYAGRVEEDHEPVGELVSDIELRALAMRVRRRVLGRFLKRRFRRGMAGDEAGQ